MSEAVRELLASAANTVDGVTVAPYFRQFSRPGDGAVRLDRMTRAVNGFGFVNTWQVVILVPQELASAEKWLDDRVTALVEALSEHMVVTEVTPQQMNVGAKTVPCVSIAGNREHE